MADMGDVLRVLGMNVARDPEEEMINTNQRDYMEDVIDRFSTKGCNPAYIPGMGLEVSLNHPETNCGTRRIGSVTNPSRVVS